MELMSFVRPFTRLRLQTMIRDRLLNCWNLIPTGKLTSVLGLMKQNADSYPSTRAVADHLLNSRIRIMNFLLAELEAALRKAAADLDMNFLYQSLLFISGDSLKQTLLDLDYERSPNNQFP